MALIKYIRGKAAGKRKGTGLQQCNSVQYNPTTGGPQ